MTRATLAEVKFKNAVRELIRIGAYPTPTRLNKLVHGHTNNTINGRECVWRREVCKELGFKLSGLNL